MRANPNRDAADELAFLHVCAECGELYDVDRPDGLNQRCGCVKDKGERWHGFDFNERVALCLCCAVEALSSGSRWSNYFCAECQKRVVDLDCRYGRIAIPIGRHSLMHSFVHNAAKPAAQSGGGVPQELHDEPGRQEVASAIFTFLTAGVAVSGRLSEWRRAAVARNLTSAGLLHASPVRDYLRAVREAGLDRQKAQAFAALCEFLNLASTGPVN